MIIIHLSGFIYARHGGANKKKLVARKKEAFYTLQERKRSYYADFHSWRYDSRERQNKCIE